MWLNWWSYNGRFTLPSLDYVGGCNVITRVLIRGRLGFREERRLSVVVFEDGGRSHKQGSKRSPEASRRNAALPILEYMYIYFEVYLFLVALALCHLSWAFPRCGAWGPLFVVINGLLIVVASLVAEYRLSRSQACGIFPDQGLNWCPLLWQTDSQPQDHQGSPQTFILDFWPPEQWQSKFVFF